MAELSRKSRLFSPLARSCGVARCGRRLVWRAPCDAVAYRITEGRAQSRTHPTMLLTVTRRQTGKTQTVPVIYIEDGGRYVVPAAYSGSDTDPSWWLNLQANPVAVVQAMGEAKAVRARWRPPPSGRAWAAVLAMIRASRGAATYAPNAIRVTLTPVGTSCGLVGRPVLESELGWGELAVAESGLGVVSMR